MKQATKEVSSPPPFLPIGGEGDWSGEWEDGDADVLAVVEGEGVTDVKEEVEEGEKGEPMEVELKPVV